MSRPSPLIYLASPYSHDLPRVRRRRAKLAAEVTGRLIDRGLDVFSPIAHSDPIDRLKPLTHDQWMRVDLAILRRCDVLVVLCLPGWEESIGVNIEISEAYARDMPRVYLREWGDDAVLDRFVRLLLKGRGNGEGRESTDERKASQGDQHSC